MILADFWAHKLVSNVQVAPNGRTVAYVVGSYDEAHNKPDQHNDNGSPEAACSPFP